ncbi:MAG: hypothetical protein BWY66_02212 [bacterium ADurb.Bin374]|nr:MAG: hypothetical protein BWY66_02212 [bacterium ADurb.Bin374]
MSSPKIRIYRVIFIIAIGLFLANHLSARFALLDGFPPLLFLPAAAAGILLEMRLRGSFPGATPGGVPGFATGTVAERLDVSVLQTRLLEPVLGIDDPRSNPRIEFVGGIRGTGELERKVTEGEAAVAFSMYPTSVESLMAIADAGEVMPPKSTWFEPKPRSGLLLHELG